MAGSKLCTLENNEYWVIIEVVEAMSMIIGNKNYFKRRFVRSEQRGLARKFYANLLPSVTDARHRRVFQRTVNQWLSCIAADIKDLPADTVPVSASDPKASPTIHYCRRFIRNKFGWKIWLAEAALQPGMAEEENRQPHYAISKAIINFK